MANIGKKGYNGFATVRTTNMYYVHKWNPNGDMETMK
jgi:hypothetical protein